MDKTMQKLRHEEMLSFLNYLSKSTLFINKVAAILNFTTTGPHGIMFINEFIIRMLNPLVADWLL